MSSSARAEVRTRHFYKTIKNHKLYLFKPVTLNLAEPASESEALAKDVEDNSIAAYSQQSQKSPR